MNNWALLKRRDDTLEANLQSAERCQRIRQALHEHVAHRLNLALKKLESKNDPETKKKREELRNKYQLAVVLEKGAGVAEHIAVASHIAKGVHPDLHSKKTTNVAVEFASLSTLEVVGSHTLAGKDGLLDTTGDGAKNTESPRNSWRLVGLS